MNQKKKNIFLLISLIALSILTGIVYISVEDKSRFGVDEYKFALELNTVITTVRIKGNDINNTFEYVDGKWFINEKFQIDRGMRDVFFAILSAVEIKRPVPRQIEDSVSQFLKENGLKVEILNNETLIKNYLAGGDQQRQVTYFMDPEESKPYIMTIPGYKSYIAGIFKVPVNDWRSRFIFNTNWSSLQKLTLNYVNEPEKNFDLVFEDEFYKLEGQKSVDSAAVFNYIESLSNFQVYRYIEKDSDPEYDSLINTSPDIIVEIKNIGDEMKRLKIYSGLQNESRRLGLLNDEQLMLLSENEIQKVLISRTKLAGQ